MFRVFAVAAMHIVVVLFASISAGLATAAELAPAKGRFLIAAQEMTDPNFEKSVILLLKYGERGAMGLIINRPTAVLPEEVIPNVAGLRRYDGPLFFGGPVQVNVVTLLVRDTDELDSGEYVLDNVQYSVNAEVLSALTVQDANASALRVYAGYAGWAAGQLEGELARGGWHVLPGDAEVIFSPEPEKAWGALAPLPEPLSASIRIVRD